MNENKQQELKPIKPNIANIKCIVKGCQVIVKVKLNPTNSEEAASQFFVMCPSHQSQFDGKMAEITKEQAQQIAQDESVKIVVDHKKKVESKKG